MDKTTRRHYLRLKSALEYLNKDNITLREVYNKLNIKKRHKAKINVPTLLDRQFKSAIERDLT